MLAVTQKNSLTSSSCFGTSKIARNLRTVRRLLSRKHQPWLPAHMAQLHIHQYLFISKLLVSYEQYEGISNMLKNIAY